jgi:hypothetical protein
MFSTVIILQCPSIHKISTYRGAKKSLARPGRKQPRKHVKDAHDFKKIETRDIIKFLFLQGKAAKEIHAILTETLACFLPGGAKDLSAPLYSIMKAYDYPKPYILELCYMHIKQ